MKRILLLTLLSTACTSPDSLTDIREYRHIEHSPGYGGLEPTGQFLTVRQAKAQGYIRYKGKWRHREDVENEKQDEKFLKRLKREYTNES